MLLVVMLEVMSEKLTWNANMPESFFLKRDLSTPAASLLAV